MPRLRLLLAAAAVALAAATAASAADPVPALPARSTLVTQQAAFRSLAEQGLSDTRTVFWNPAKRWYTTTPGADSPLATTWFIFPFLELAASVAIADPTAAHRKFVVSTFQRAEGYWDYTLGKNGSGGVSWALGLHHTGNAYFDDTGWWGVAYLDAYRATGNERWLRDAGRALSYIDEFGWDPKNGGTWWDSGHAHKTSEPLAAGALIAATLYHELHKPKYLEIAKRYIGWADANTRNPAQGNLYGRSATDRTIMDYVEGMMLDADVQLCKATKQQSWCAKAEGIAAASLEQFPVIAPWGPEMDVIYERALLDLYAQDHDPRWYAAVYANGVEAAQHARGADGLWDRNWTGAWSTNRTIFGQSATLELFAWLAGATPPGG